MSEWGKDYGSAATKEVLRISFEELNLARIYLHVFPEHKRGVHCYEKCGFRHEGLERRLGLKHGGWHDMLRMSILRKEWAALQETPSGIHIREFIWADYEQVMAVWNVVFSPHPQDVPEELCKKLQRDQDLFLLACAGARVIGTVIGGWDGRRGYIYRMAVYPDYQRQGIGRMLLQELELRFRSKGAMRIALNYYPGDPRAHEFYRSLGFEDWPDTAMMGKDI